MALNASAGYDRAESEALAKEHLRGVCDVILPSFTQDLSR